MKAFAVALLLVLLAGCTRLEATDQSQGGAEGVVMAGPTCPVEHEPPEPGCEDQPFAADLDAVRTDGQRTWFSSGEDGAFRVPLPPGDYSIEGRQGAQPPVVCSSEPFTVVADAYTTVAVSCDTGIR